MPSLRDDTGLLLVTRSTLVDCCDLTQPLPFLWPAGILVVCIIHIKAVVVYPHNMDAPALTNLFKPGAVRILLFTSHANFSLDTACIPLQA